MERRVTRMGIAHSRVHGSGSPANPGIAKTVFLTGAIVELTGPILRGIERPDTGIIRLNTQNCQLFKLQYCYLSCYTIAHLVTRTDTSSYWIFNNMSWPRPSSLVA
jgi:hypothetical protein